VNHTRTEPPPREELRNLEAERAVLAAVLVNPDLFIDLSAELTPEDFGTPAHTAIWAAYEGVDAGHGGIDTITVAEELRLRRELDTAGGEAYLQDLQEGAAPTGHIGDWVRIVRKKSRLRRTWRAGWQMATDALAPDADADDVLSDAEAAVLAVSAPRGADTLITMAQAVAETQQHLEKARSRDLLGHPTGFSRLDQLSHGLQPGQLVLIAARPGMGKSAIALNIANHISEVTGDLVYYASYEMTATDLTIRMLATYSGIPLNELKTGRIPEALERDFAQHAAKIAELPLLMNSRPPATVQQLRSELRRVSRRGPLAAVFIDYLQLMHGSSTRREENRNQEVSEISRSLKETAMELEVPIVALSQLNRGVDARPDKRPRLSDLRESGSLEQDADAVWMIYRDAVYNDAAPSDAAELIIEKHRSGPTGTVPLSFNGPCSRFVDARSDTPAGRGPRPPAGASSGPIF